MKKEAIVVSTVFLAIAFCMMISEAKAPPVQWGLQVIASNSGLPSVTFQVDYTSGGVYYPNTVQSTPWSVNVDDGTTATIHDAPEIVLGPSGVRWRYLQPTLPHAVIMDAHHTVTLSYRRQVEITLSVTPPGSGTITDAGPTNIEGTKWYDAYNQQYIIQAHANLGYHFVGWTASNALIYIDDIDSANTYFEAGGPSAGPGEITAVFVLDFVIPEVPFGTIVASISMIAALAGFAGFQRYRMKLQR